MIAFFFHTNGARRDDGQFFSMNQSVALAADQIARPKIQAAGQAPAQRKIRRWWYGGHASFRRCLRLY